jgi:hypothetical protein
MDREKWRIFIFIFYIITIVFGLVLIILNIEMISVVHAKESEWIPVIKYETYSSLEVFFLYFVISLAVINMIFINIKRLFKIIPFINVLSLLVAIVFILLFFLNPHILIINPTGLPPTRLDAIEIGGILSIIIFIILILNLVMNLLITKYIQYSLKLRRE